MSTNLYFLSDGKTQPMAAHLYEQEADLQKIIADNPELLIRQSVGDELLMLVKQEQAVQGTEADATSYSLDHLFVDQDGIPVLVEVKRSTDTRIRREVVGQVIDYAARARDWDIEKLRTAFMANNKDSDIRERFDNEDFWRAVETNLKAEHFRLVFAADQIPDSLRTLILFLDRNFSNIEVYGVEIQQYKTKDGTTMLTTNVIENVRTEESRQKPTVRSEPWTAETFDQFIEDVGHGHLTEAITELRQFIVESGMMCIYGRGIKYPSFGAKIDKKRRLFSVTPWTYSDGFRCAIGVDLFQLESYLDGKYTPEELRAILEDMPEKDKDLQNNLIWRSPQTFYMNSVLLESPEKMAAFKASLQRLQKEILQTT